MCVGDNTLPTGNYVYCSILTIDQINVMRLIIDRSVHNIVITIIQHTVTLQSLFHSRWKTKHGASCNVITCMAYLQLSISSLQF